jgi:hypothetical protein
MNKDKKISPQAIMALKEALSVIFWRKEDLQDFIKLSINNNQILATIYWDGTKRGAVKELIERMTNRLDIFQNDLMNLLVAVTDFNDFSNLKHWDQDGTKTKTAIEAINKLRTHTKGHFQLTKEEEDGRQRKMAAEKVIIANKSLNDELSTLRDRFNLMATTSDLQKRGYQLEKFLYDLLLLYELDPKGSFKNYGEQIDGAFSFQGTDYLLEAKWKHQVDRGELASFCYKVETKFKTAVGLLVTINGVTGEAITPDFKSIIIMDALDLMAILDGRISLPDLLFKKRRRASETGKIYLSYSQL